MGDHNRGRAALVQTAIVNLSNRIEIDWIEAKSLETAKTRELVATWPGTLAAALVTPPSGEPLITVSIYAQWVRTHVQARSNFLFSDGSGSHVVSDLSTFIAKADGHRVLAAGDMNILRDYGEYGDEYWAARYKTVFDRMATMGLLCVGRNTRMAGRPIPGPTNCRETAGMSPPFIPTGKRRRRQGHPHPHPLRFGLSGRRPVPSAGGASRGLGPLTAGAPCPTSPSSFEPKPRQ